MPGADHCCSRTGSLVSLRLGPFVSFVHGVGDRLDNQPRDKGGGPLSKGQIGLWA